jgi:hypothetical protein
MAAGVISTLWSLEDIVRIADEWEANQRQNGPCDGNQIVRCGEKREDRRDSDSGSHVFGNLPDSLISCISAPAATASTWRFCFVRSGPFLLWNFGFHYDRVDVLALQRSLTLVRRNRNQRL